MLKIVFMILIVFINVSLAKEISVEVMATSASVTPEMNEEQVLTINGYRQIVTSELEDLKLNSELFWSKLEQKKLSSKDEIAFLNGLFENVLLARAEPAKPSEDIKVSEKLSGNFKADLNLEKLKLLFLEVTTDLADTKLKTFYLLADINIDSNMDWEDLGVQNSESFRGVIIDSWKKLFLKDFKGFEKFIVLENDLTTKPDYLNNKSVTLKWTSTFKKVANNPANHTASYELTAHYIIQNTKLGSSILAFDFPIQKRDFDVQNKKALSSSLASLVYNLLLSQSSKISGILMENAGKLEQSEVEIKIVSKTGLLEINQINSFLQDKFKDLKLSSQMKSYSSSGSTLIIRADGNGDKILDALSLGGGKLPFNEQKVLLFNRADKSFAILPKESNN